MAASKNSFVYFDDAEVTRTSKRYKVILKQENVTMYFKQEIVDSIKNMTDEDANLVAILLAHIEFVRRNTNKEDIGVFVRKLENEDIVEGLEVLLRYKSLEELIEIVQTLKWHQIVEIMTAESPIEELRNL